MNTTEQNSEVQQRIVQAVSGTSKEYVAGDAPEWRYPLLDGEPPKGKKLNLLTSGGVAVMGQWSDGSNYIAWAPLIKASKAKEHMIKLLQNFTGSNTRKALLHAIFKHFAKNLMPGVNQERLYEIVSGFLQVCPNTQQFQALPAHPHQVKLLDSDPETNMYVTFTRGECSIKVYVWKPFVNFVFHIPNDTEFNAQAVSDLIMTALSVREVTSDIESKYYAMFGQYLYVTDCDFKLMLGPYLAFRDETFDTLRLRKLEQ